MVNRIRRRRSAKHTEKEEEDENNQYSEIAEIESAYQQSKIASPIRIYVPVDELEEQNKSMEEENECEARDKMSPPPREVLKCSQNDDQIACNIYNLSPQAVEKRKKMMNSRFDIKELDTCNIIPQLLEMSQKAKVSEHLPLMLTKSLSEGCDPFESVKRSLSNGTLQRDKIFSKIKICNDVRIGGKAGSNFNPFIKANFMSNHTASSSYERGVNEEENEKKLLDYLDNYSAEVLQKTALVLLEKSLSRSQSFEIPMAVESATEIPLQLKFFEKISEKNETLSEETSDFKPCNCRKSKCLKLYCECFSNGRKCTSKCDCSPCCNTPAHEELIAKAKDMIITRNPDAFKPKFNEHEETKKEKGVKHQRGCNCQKSNCLKKYCECYQMNVECSDLCRCIECHNCKHPDDSKHSLLGKRKRMSFPLNELNEDSAPKAILSPINHKDNGYFVKARKAKENRYLKFNDYSVELLGNKKVKF